MKKNLQCFFPLYGFKYVFKYDLDLEIKDSITIISVFYQALIIGVILDLIFRLI